MTRKILAKYTKTHTHTITTKNYIHTSVGVKKHKTLVYNVNKYKHEIHYQTE